MIFNYGDGNTYSILNYLCNVSAADQSLQCPTGYSFCIGIPFNSYTGFGNMTASATLYNSLYNQMNASLNFFIYSQIHNLTDSLYVMPFGFTQSAPNSANYWPLTNVPFYPLERPIWFVSTLQFGTETPVTYWWNFGDGSYNITTAPFVLHQYANPGTYNIKLNTSNPVSNDETNFIENQFLNGVNQTTSIIVQRFQKFLLFLTN